MPEVVTIIQARTGSSRLPGKVIRPLCGAPLLARLVQRVQAARLCGAVVVATTNLVDDNPIAWICQTHDFPCFRGHPTDLLDRHYRAAQRFNADVVVKIPSDCPLIDPAIIDRVIGAYLAQPHAYDYVSNLHPATYPDGNDVEVMRFDALAAAWREAERPLEREHTTPFLWENPARFRLHNVAWETGLNLAMTHRWTIDYEADYQFIRAVYEALYAQNPLFELREILALLAERPELAQINARYAGENWYRHHLHELRTVSATETRG